ncbi:MAG TPA: hypothetical protein VFN60_11375 [Acidimicrobiales bacterium]|nr:hypothetical protein [Acidimicrobiales bacterium]
MHERWTVRWFRKRALVYHLLVAIIAPGCAVAADWQIHRAMGGNLLSWLYAVEWPVFSILAIVGWWQLIHEDPARVESRKVERARRAATKGPFVPPPPDSASGFYHPLQVASRPELAAELGRDLPVLREDDGELVAPDDATPVHQLSEYNAYLARLAVGRTRKSWRNPHGAPTKS